MIDEDLDWVKVVVARRQRRDEDRASARDRMVREREIARRIFDQIGYHVGRAVTAFNVQAPNEHLTAGMEAGDRGVVVRPAMGQSSAKWTLSLKDGHGHESPAITAHYSWIDEFGQPHESADIPVPVTDEQSPSGTAQELLEPWLLKL